MASADSASRLFFRYDIPETGLQAIEPGSRLPGGIVALYDRRGRDATPLWLPQQRALIFADAFTAPGGESRVWTTPWHKERVLPALRALLDLPFEHAIVSHGEPGPHSCRLPAGLGPLPWAG
jgi:hypothetical protein